MQATIPDLLRLLAVPVLGWAAVRDLRTRRVPNRVWWPLAILGLGLVAWEGYGQLGSFGFRLYLLRVGLSIGFVIPLAYGFWYVGGFGGADAKAFMVLALLFPTFPTYQVIGAHLPVVVTDIGVFSLTVLTNTVLVGLAYPVVLAIENAVHGEFALHMFLGRRVPVEEVQRRYGTLLETPSGFTRSGLDLDALRMYLRWRGTDLATLRSTPALMDPATLPAEPNDPTDGAVHADGGSETVGGEPPETDGDLSSWEWVADEFDDPWGAEAFLEDIDSSAYGTSPAKLRDGLDVLVDAEAVWVSPGIPFIVPTFVGLVLALTAGDLLFWVLGVGGFV